MGVIAVTGAAGFLGWHTRVLAHARGEKHQRAVDRAAMNTPAELGDAVSGADHVVHCAGVNRGPDAEVYAQNVALAEQLSAALRAAARPPRTLAFANSAQSTGSGGYAEGKARAAAVLAAACADTGIEFTDVLLPNLFGEHGRPDYNSVVATFCDALAHGREPVIRGNGRLRLLGVRDAAAQLLAPDWGQPPPSADPTAIDVAGLLDILVDFDRTYRRADIPRLDTRFRTQLFNTYRSFTFPWRFPIRAVRRSDERGTLVETVRVHGGTGQAFFSTTRPGATRGQHFHLDKLERFVVLGGAATIALRRVLTDEVVSFSVTGDDPVIVDMPTLWTHKITNVGSGPLLTQFWTDQLFDPAAPDTIHEEV